MEDIAAQGMGGLAAHLACLAKEDPQRAVALMAIVRSEQPPKRYGKQYTPPSELKVNGIPTVVVDPHNEALYYWVKALREQPAPRTALLVHVDHHSDLYDANIDVQAVIGSNATLATAPLEQVRAVSQCLNIAEFIEPAVTDGILLPTVFWYQPYTKRMKKYCYSTSSRKLMQFTLFSDRKLPFYSFSDVPDGQRIWDIDLDAFSCNSRKADGNEGIDGRIATTERVLSGFGQKPVCITLATSQTPLRYLRKNDVAYVTEKTIAMLERLLK